MITRAQANSQNVITDLDLTQVDFHGERADPTGHAHKTLLYIIDNLLMQVRGARPGWGRRLAADLVVGWGVGPQVSLII